MADPILIKDLDTHGTALDTDYDVVGDVAGNAHKVTKLTNKLYFLRRGGGGARILVASSTAPTWVSRRADYVCDGVDDHVEINAALQEGSVELSDGDFKPASDIIVDQPGHSLRGTGIGENSSQSIGRGIGAGTRILPSALWTGTAFVNVQQSAAVGPAGQTTISDMKIDGANVPIATNADGLLWRSYQGRLSNIYTYRTPRHGFVLRGFTTGELAGGWHTYDCVMDACRARAAGRWDLKGSSGQNTDGSGLYLDHDAQDTYLSDSTFLNNIAHGIHRHGGASIQCVNVQCYSNALCGIYYDSGGSRDKWLGCKIEHNDHHGLFFDGSGASGTSGVQLTGCEFGGNGEATSNTYSHIACSGTNQTSRAKVTGCHFATVDGSQQAKYCIDLSLYGTNWTISGNDFGTSLASAGVVTAKVNIGNATVRDSLTMVGNSGVRDHNGGTNPTAAAGANAGTSPPAPVVATNSSDERGDLTFGTGTTPAAGAQVVVTYNTPTSVTGNQPFVAPANAAAAALGTWYVSTWDNNGFTITCTGTPAASQANTVYRVRWTVSS